MKSFINSTRVLWFLFLIIFFYSNSSVYSQSWSPMGGGTGWGNALAVYNGELYAGGVYGLLKWSGASWVPVGSGVTGEVDALVVYNNKLVVGGKFSDAGGIGTPFLDQWNGTTWSDLGSAPNSYVQSLAVYGNKLIIAGYFTQCENLPANHIVQYDGNNFTTLGSGTGGSQGQIMALTTWNNQLIAGGFFTTAGGVSVSHIASWNGSAWSDIGGGTNSIIYALYVYKGDLIAGGLFNMAGGNSAPCVASWNGTAWSGLGSGCGGGFYPYVFAFATYGNDLYVGGYYTIAGGMTANGIARWDGSSWSTLGSGFWNGGSNVFGANALLVFNNNLVATGIFSSAGGVGAGNVAQWDGLITGTNGISSNTPDKFKLGQNYPNPFNPSTKIQFSVPAGANNIKLIVYNILGKEVETLINGKYTPGNYEVQWNASNYPSGNYFYRLITDSYTETKKMTLVK
jgi:hypothetical protein